VPLSALWSTLRSSDGKAPVAQASAEKGIERSHHVGLMRTAMD
jgi:hypothetical protein